MANRYRPRLTRVARVSPISAMKYGTAPIDPGLAIRPNLLRWLPGTPALAFREIAPKSPAAIRAWQKKARAAFDAALLNDVPSVPLRPRVLEKKQLDGYTRTTLTLDTTRGIRALAWLCIPDGLSKSRGKHAAMIATPGHGMGAKDLLAMDKHGKPRKEGDGYQKDYALQAVRLGYPVLTVEPIGFGERRDADHMSGKSGESPCQAAFALALMQGTTIQRLRFNDLQRGLDYLGTTGVVDASRVGIMGISGGGQMSLYTAALDTRFKAAIVSGYINRFRESALGMYHCICNFMPGLASKLDMEDLGALVAPRGLLLESGTKDPIFPIAATRAAAKNIRKVYEQMNAGDRFEVDIFEGDHQWSGRKVEAFLKKTLA